MIRAAALLATLAVAAAGCSAPSPSPDPGSAGSTNTPYSSPFVPPVTEPDPQSPAAPGGQDEVAALPTELVGTWSSTGGSAQLIYRFAPDGTYEHSGALTQQRPSGVFSFAVSAVGTVTVDGSVLVLQPVSGTQELRDPDAPSSNWTRPVDTTPERYGWTVQGSQLALTDANHSTITYDRQ
jgi:subtilisin family serine protease